MALRNSAALVLGGVSLIAMGPALAQQTVPAPSAAAARVAQATALEEIVVTARRREEQIQSVPIAITALSQDSLTANRVMQFNDLQHYVPGFRQFQSASRREGDQISIRSLPGALTYFAEATATRIGAGRFYDLENVQVLEGPQGTLFGGLANGGAILFEPKRPTNNLEGYGSVTFGNYNDKEFDAALNIPILADKVLLRFAGTRQEREGFTTDVGPFFPGRKYDNRDHWSWRGGLTVKPLERVENYTVYDGYYRHTRSTGNKLLAINPLGNVPRVFPTYQQVLDQQNAIGPRATAISTDQLDKAFEWIMVNITQVEVTDTIRFKNIFSWQELKGVDRYEFEGSTLRITDRPNDTGWRSSSKIYSDEANLQGDFFDSKLRLTGGFYWDGTRPLEIAAARAYAFNALSNVPETGHAGNYNNQYAGYGQASLDLGSVVGALDGLKITGGIRRSASNSHTVSFVYNPLTGACSSNAGHFYPDCSGPPTILKYKAWTWMVGVDYQVTPDLLLYAVHKKGFRPGSVNATAPLAALRVVRPESVLDYEVGLKKDWDFDNGVKARTNFAYYRDDYNDIQRTAGFFDPVTNISGTLTQNAAKAVLQGAEFTGTLIPTQAFELSVSYAWAAPYYKSYFSQLTTGTLDLSGLAIANNPRHKYNIQGTYHLPVADTLGDLSATLTWYWQGRYWGSSPEATPFGEQVAYGLLNLRVDWRGIGGYPLDASFFITNVTNKTFLESGNGGAYNATSLGLAVGYYNEPRMYGVSLKYRFGPM